MPLSSYHATSTITFSNNTITTTGYFSTFPGSITTAGTSTLPAWADDDCTTACTTNPYCAPDSIYNHLANQPTQQAALELQQQLQQQTAEGRMLMAQSNQEFNALLAVAQRAVNFINPVAAKRSRSRARALLRSVLTAEQWTSFCEVKMFEIEGRSGQRYRVHHGRIANIEVPALGYRLCVHPDPRVNMPVEDVLVSQVLHLRADDLGLARTANVHPGLGGPRG